MKRRKHGGIPSYIPVTLLTAIFLLCLGCRIDSSALPRWFSRLGQNEAFVTDAIALELGVLPQLSLDSGQIQTDSDQEKSEDASTWQALLSESSYVPAAKSGEVPAYGKPDSRYPVKERKITTKTGAGCLNAQGVSLHNQSGLAVDLNQMLKNPVSISLDQKGEVEVFLLHTHASEAYTPDSAYAYTPSDNIRSHDTRFNVVRVGDEIASVLEDMGIGVAHCREILDDPSYTGSYNRAMSVINQQLKKTPSVKVIIDIHRDAMIAADGTSYKVVTELNGQKCAQLMLVMGTNAGGLTHDHWRTNLNFAVNLQKRINACYDGLMRPVNVRRQRFNEQATTGSMLLEVGTSGNTLSEALVSARYFAKVLGETLTT